MNEASLKVRLREAKTQKPWQLRKQGLIPAVLYGPGVKNQLFLVDQAEFSQFLKLVPKNQSFKLKIVDNGTELDNVLVHEIQKDNLSGQILNIDFYQFSAQKRIRLSVPIGLTGKAPALELGGVLVTNMTELEVECLPVNLPEKIMVDISVLKELDSTIYVGDLKLPEGVICHLDPKTPVVSVTEATPEVAAEMSTTSGGKGAVTATEQEATKAKN